MTEADFLSALRAEPADAVAWLALADWLDEHGHAGRAELLRATRASLTLSADDPARSAVERRANQLLAAGIRPAVIEEANSLGMRFVLVPAGRFRMGEGPPKSDRADEPDHEVTLTRPYYLGVFAVTQRQYRSVTRRAPSAFRAGGTAGGAVADLDTADFPVENVSWQDAQEFCERLSDSLAEIREGRSYRLPTEAEWERACRAGTTTAFHTGDALPVSRANFTPYRGEPGIGRTCAVGSYAPNAFGLYDMHGNVNEWCHDFYDASAYRATDRTDPRGGTEGPDHPLRGGSYLSDSAFCRSAWRDYNEAEARLDINGFRVVMERR